MSVTTIKRVGLLERAAGYEPRRTEPPPATAPEADVQLCPRRAFNQGRSCKRRDCSVCGARWARRWSQVFLRNLLHNGGQVAMITITAPGVDALPWDRGRCLIQAPHKCTGPSGCVVEEHAADEWSADVSDRWRRLRQAARIDAVRAMRLTHGSRPRLLGRVWEPQLRGVPHLHVVVDCSTPELAAAAEAFRSALARLAPDYGFGFVDLDLSPNTPQRAAGYVAGYLTGRQKASTTRARKSTIRQNISNPRMPRSLLWVTPELTRVTRVTMRTLRYTGWYWAALQGRCDVLPRLFGKNLNDVITALLTVDRQRRRGPPIPEEVFRLRHFRNLRLMRELQPAYDWRAA